MNVSEQDILTWIGAYFWTLVRIAALVGSAPVFSSRSVPARVKLSLALAVTLLVAPFNQNVPTLQPLSADMVLITFNQVLIGIAMGICLQVVFSMFVVGGQVVAYQMGLGFSQMVDPTSGMRVPVISQFYIITITLLFFSMNGHLAVLQTLIDSFKLLPISTQGIQAAGFWEIIEWSKQMFLSGVNIALPAIASVFLVNFTFGVVTRSAPQFNIFAIGFPITILMGFLIIYVTATSLYPHFSTQIGNALNVSRSVLQAK
jgi:flagellar biosynthetic protein FliR